MKPEEFLEKWWRVSNFSFDNRVNQAYLKIVQCSFTKVEVSRAQISYHLNLRNHSFIDEMRIVVKNSLDLQDAVENLKTQFRNRCQNHLRNCKFEQINSIMDIYDSVITTELFIGLINDIRPNIKDVPKLTINKELSFKSAIAYLIKLRILDSKENLIKEKGNATRLTLAILMIWRKDVIFLSNNWSKNFNLLKTRFAFEKSHKSQFMQIEKKFREDDLIQDHKEFAEMLGRNLQDS